MDILNTDLDSKTQQGYDEARLSVSEIARLAGVSRQTLYRYLDISQSSRLAG